MTFMQALRRVPGDARAATSVEYGLILAMVFLAMVGAVQAFGIEMTQIFNKVSTTSVTAMQGVGN